MERYLDTLKKGCVTVLNQTPSAFFSLLDLELNSPGSGLSISFERVEAKVSRDKTHQYVWDNGNNGACHF